MSWYIWDIVGTRLKALTGFYGVESQDPETPQYEWLGGYHRTWDQKARAIKM